MGSRPGQGEGARARPDLGGAMSKPELTGLLDQALHAERQGRFEEARGLLRRVIDADEAATTLDARLQLGKLLIQGGHPHHDEAEAVLAAARAEAEQSGSTRLAAHAIHLLALLRRHLGRFDEALQLLDESP